MDPAAETCILVGYSETMKAYWIYLPHSGMVVVRRDVRFEEEKAFTRSRECEESLTHVTQQQQQQVIQVQSPSTGESGGTGGGSVVSVVTGSPVVSSQTSSQCSPQVSTQSSSQLSPLMDSSHGTLADTLVGSPGSRGPGAGSPSGVVQEVVTGSRRPRWLTSTLRDADSGVPEGLCSGEYTS